MRLRDLRLYCYTLRYLKPKQVLFRLYYLMRRRWRRLSGFRYSAAVSGRVAVPADATRHLAPFIPSRICLQGDTFTFLNLTRAFPGKIDWEFAEFGKLWQYNLSYFDYLLQPGMTREHGEALIRSFIDHAESDGAAYEPYPISLRTIHWIKFLLTTGAADAAEINAALMAQYVRLLDHPEYHLLGNHLLENGFSLLFGGVYFDDERLCRKASEILQAELHEQILPDGGHFERSPMYHQILLGRVLDCINLLKCFDHNPCRGMLPLMEEKAGAMLGWLGQMTFRDGTIPLVNDAAYGIAPTTGELTAYAERLGVGAVGASRLRESGYRKVSTGCYEAVLDVGDIGPDYIPGHAHADTLSFELRVGGKPLIVDTGTSTYEDNDVRRWQRSSKAHNTVMVAGLDQSEMWGSFRVARRAYVKAVEEGKNFIAASHTGYERIGATHRRRFEFNDREIRINDEVHSKKPYDCEALLHFHPDVRLQVSLEGILADDCKIICDGAARIELQNYEYAPEFNRLIPAKMAVIRFRKKLETVIRFS